MRLARSIFNRLRFSRDDAEQIEALIANHMKFKDVPHMKESTLKRFLRLPRFDEHLELHRLDVSSSNRNLETYELVRAKLSEYGQERLKPQPLLNGADLIAAGYTPGPQFSAMLAAVEDAQLEGELHTAGEALRFVRERFPQ